MIVVFAGRRPGTPDFPTANSDAVADQVNQLLGGLQPRLLIGSAAAGADLLALEAGEALGIDAMVLIAGDRDAFLQDSVADKGEEWVRRYEHQMNRTKVQSLPMKSTSTETYRSVTRAIAKRATDLAQPKEAVVVLAISAPREAGIDHTEELVAEFRGPNGVVLRIDPSRRRSELPSAVVAMPFGAKAYPDQGWRRFEADLTYQRVIMPALIDAGYRPLRADSDALLEVIDHTMLRAINAADVMIVDLAMLNANVMWELGLRHAWRRSGTILLAPDWLKVPFDIKRVPVYSYRRTAQRIADTDAVEAIRTLQKVLRSVPERRVDSPVFANVNALTEVALPDPPQTSGESAGSLLEAATLAGDLRDVQGLMRIAGQIDASPDLPETARTALIEQIGFRLIALDEYKRARALLEPLAIADEKFSRRRLQEQYAHLLIRGGEAIDDDQLELAERRLKALRKRYGASGETLGLLGSAAKAKVERAAAAHQAPPAAELERAIRAYVHGMEEDPGDSYPGINAVALLRLRGQRWQGSPSDLVTARELLPVVRFAASRGQAAADVWVRLTTAECALHDYFLNGDEARLAEANSAYAAAARDVEPQQRRSAGRQLRLMRNAGDTAEILDPLLGLFQ